MIPNPHHGEKISVKLQAPRHRHRQPPGLLAPLLAGVLILFSISAIASARLAKRTGGELIVFLAISIAVYIPGVPNSSQRSPASPAWQPGLGAK
jgi:hypothetical protein